jgi:hypothetical protein
MIKMSSFKIFIIAASLGFAAMITQAFIIIKDKDALKVKTEADKGFAVVELFTSEGCSSCPPADALVARVQKEDAGKPVYILAYHVDYWNRLGWKDVFSDAAYSARQQQYARWLNLSSVYTPQAVVNGRKEFVGSENGTLHEAIASDLQRSSKAEVILNGLRENDGKAELQYQALGTPVNAALVVALVEKNATTRVERGENGGRTLSHVQIVRKLQNVNLAGHSSGNLSIALPAGFNADGYEVIAFVQNTSNGEITAAAKSGFSSAMSNKTK